ncbi:MAG: lamin tail domain-containing protein, partial [Bacteroidota bacterium]
QTVCLTASRQDGPNLCQQTRCMKINLDFNPGLCQTIQNGSCPYSPLDPVFQQVVASDDFCCEDEWDVLCEMAYVNLSQGNANDTIGNPGVPYDYDFPLLPDNENKILVHRLLAVPEFHQRYLDIACIILQTNFRAERLFPLIDQQAALIRQAVYEDTNYFFTRDYFEYDLGNGTGGGGGAGIPSLRWVLLKRFGEMLDDMAATQHDCTAAFSPIGWHGLVINELVATNTAGATDPAGENDDWIELFNPGSEPVDLSYFFLTDEFRTPLQWKFPAGTTIEPGGYLIVWADKNDLQPGLHANFKLSKTGETLMLRHEDGTMIDSVTFGAQADNLAYARVPNGEGDFVSQTTTFSASNNLPSGVTEPATTSIFKVFPNPVSEVLTLEFFPVQPGERREAVLRNLLGATVWSETNLASRQAKIDVSALEPGVYFLECRSGERRQAVKILIF